MPAIVAALLETIVSQVGLPLLLKWIASAAPADEVQAILDAEYAAARAAVDAEAKAALT